ncbi:MAG: hypothetical protein IPL06_17470 [Betaproteobacteria bacterium]|nr:hypothetical protein [Betaproteobacteria bacterium]
MTARLAASLIVFIAAGCASMPGHDHAGHAAPAPDARVAVDFPEPLRTHTLANMRDHLLALQEIQQALATGATDKASQVAEARLGMTSLQAHGAHDVAKFMPEGMQSIGTQMHRSASRFAVEATNAGVTGDVKPALGALAIVTAQCVACHAGYRMK